MEPIIKTLCWFTIHTKPRKEELAVEHLQNQGYVTYLPQIKLNKRLRGHWREMIEPLFPRYLFIQANLAETSLSPVRSTHGVIGLVRFGEELIPVPDEVIAFLKSMEAGEAAPDSPFQRGDAVEILDGPFAGLKGVYDMEKGRDRAFVLLDLLGSQRAVAIKVDHLSRY